MDKTTKRCGNILVVDDTLENLRFLVETLSARGYTVRPALNGKIALRAAFSQPPDLVLLDIIMPEMDGYQVCERLKANPDLKEVPVIFLSALNPDLKEVPVIFLSALDETSDKVKGFTLGAVDYVRKPFHAEELVARIETHLTIRKLKKDLERRNAHLEKANRELEQALEEIKTLRGILPICSHCKKIRDDRGYWNQIDAYIEKHSLVDFSHGICPDCVKKYYPDFE